MTENMWNETRWMVNFRSFFGGQGRRSRPQMKEQTDDVESSMLLTETKLHADYSSAAVEEDHAAEAISDISDERSFQRSISNTWENYYSLLEQKPLLVKSVTAFFILGMADMCAQGIEHLRGTSSFHGAVDWPRAARFGAFGLFGAPFSHYYFFYLDHYLKPTPEPFTRTTLLKVFIDQVSIIWIFSSKLLVQRRTNRLLTSAYIVYSSSNSPGIYDMRVKPNEGGRI